MVRIVGREDAIRQPDRAAHSARSEDRTTPSSGDLGDLGRGSIWALGAVASTALSGFLFWVLAAETSTSSADVGRAAAWFT